MDVAYLARSWSSSGITSWADFLAAPWWEELIVVGVIVLIIWVWVRTLILPALSKIQFRGHTLAGMAQVLAVKSTGTVTNNTGYECKIALRVEVPGREPYDVTVRQTIDVAAMAAIRPGTTVPVKVLAAHPRRVRIDFDQPVRPQARSQQANQVDYVGAVMADLENQVQQIAGSGAGPVPQAADLLASGQRVPGVLMSFSANGDSTDSTYSRPELRGAPNYLLTVELHIPNLAPMTARNVQPVPLAVVPKLALGLQLTCAVDPADPKKLFAVDWCHI